jgi:HD-like signal output (HDOD) protein
MSDKTPGDARQEILEIKHLPPLSITATRLLGAIGNPDVEVEDLADIINHDPGLMGRIVGLANAAYFGQRNPITTVQEAIIRVLGINMVKSLALSISVSGAFQVGNCPGFDIKEYWFNAIGCATLARMMALRIPIEHRPDPDQIYLSGLLHNLGFLVLAHLYPSKLATVFTLADENPESTFESLQQEHIGVDWISAGEWLVDRWHLPSFIGETMRSVAGPADTSVVAHDINLVRSSVQWLKDIPNDASELPRLRLYDSLLQIPGLNEDALDLIEEKFLIQSDELHSLAAHL